VTVTFVKAIIASSQSLLLIIEDIGGQCKIAVCHLKGAVNSLSRLVIKGNFLTRNLLRNADNSD
jgi:hypothetical protein